MGPDCAGVSGHAATATRGRTSSSARTCTRDFTEWVAPLSRKAGVGRPAGRGPRGPRPAASKRDLGRLLRVNELLGLDDALGRGFGLVDRQRAAVQAVDLLGGARSELRL